MDRKEAAEVLNEVMRKCNGASLTKRVCLSRISQMSDSENFELQITEPDEYLRECIGVVLKKRNLAVKKSNNVLTIYRPETK